MRGLAILAVLCHHLWVPWARGGFAGVDLFFVLSGFLITTLLCEEWESTGSIRLGAFYLRRAFRLLPALLLVLACLMIYAATLAPPGKASPLVRAAAVALFYSTNWFVAYRALPFGPLEHTWSLSIEEQYYVLWPGLLLLLLSRRVPQAWILATLGASIAASAAFRMLHWHVHHDHGRLYYGSDSRADGLLLGSLTALLLSWDLLPRRAGFGRWVLVAATAGLAAWTAWVVRGVSHNELHRGGFLVLDAAGVLLVVALVKSPRSLLGRAFEFPVLVWIGKVSYGLYLWHFPIYFLADRLPYPGASAAGAVLRLAATFAVAAVSFHAFEKPLLDYGRRRFAAARPGPAAA